VSNSKLSLSHFFSITIKRWLSLFLCAVTASSVIFIFSEFIWLQNAFTSYNQIITAKPWIYTSSAFLGGVGIKVLLERFYIAHPQRAFAPNLRYPPITISILMTLTILGYVFIYSKDDWAETLVFMLENQVFTQLCLVISGICAANLYHSIKKHNLGVSFSILLTLVLPTLFIALGSISSSFFYVFLGLYFYFFSVLSIVVFIEILCSKPNKMLTSNSKSNKSAKAMHENFKTLSDFENWFKDDTPITSINELEADYQVYAKRIYQRLIHGGVKDQSTLAQHIALCGPFGCGKSSIIACIVNELKQNNVTDTKANWLHCDISTWGAEPDNLAQVVLAHIIDVIAEKLDMCAFRSLPNHYVEALKGGGSQWQIFAALITKNINEEQYLEHINHVLVATNINLLVTLQDIDRGTEDDTEKRLNTLGSLLDRLKNRNLTQLNFIIALGNEQPQQLEVISKVTSTTEHLLNLNFTSIINSYTYLAIEKAVKNDKIIVLSDNIPKYNCDSFYTIILKNEDDYKKLVTISPRTGKPQQNNFFRAEVKQLSHAIYSSRILKKVLRRVNEAWQVDKLMGEMNIMSILMLTTLREVNPRMFSQFNTQYDSLFKAKDGNITPILNDIVKDKDGGIDVNFLNYLIVMLGLVKKEMVHSSSGANPFNKSDTDRIDEIFKYITIKTTAHEENKNEVLTFNPELSASQTIGCNDNNQDYIDYLSRFKLEQIPQAEKDLGSIDQVIIIEIIELLKLSFIEFIERLFEVVDDKYFIYQRFIPLFYNASKVDNKESVHPLFNELKRNYSIDKKSNTFDRLLKPLIRENLTINNAPKILNIFLKYEKQFQNKKISIVNILNESKRENLTDYLARINTDFEIISLAFKYSLTISLSQNKELSYITNIVKNYTPMTDDDIISLTKYTKDEQFLSDYPLLKEELKKSLSSYD
jgi:hypothetical protein